MKKLILLVLATLVSFPLSAEFRLIRRESLQKLDNATIYSIVADQKDALWISSNQGLLRYNGSFLSKLEDPLPMHELVFDGEDLLYALSKNHILSYRTNTLEVRRICLPPVPGDDPIALCAGQDGLWFAKGNSLWHCPKGDNELQLVLQLEEGQGIDALQENAQGRLYLASGSFVSILDGDRAKAVIQLHSAARSLFFSSNGNLWVGYKTGGVASYDRQYALIREYRLKGNNYRTFCEGEDGLFIGSENELSFIGTEGKAWIPPVGTLEHQPVTSLCRTRNGFLWAGTFYSGIYRVMSEDGALQNLPYPEELHNFRAIAPSAGDDFVLLTDGNGAWVYNAEGFRLIQHSEALKFQSGIYLADDGLFYTGIYTGGARLLQPGQNYRFTKSNLPDDDDFFHYTISDFLYQDGRLWCATDNGIYLLERKEGRWEFVLHRLAGKRFYSLSIDSRGKLWVAGEGVYAIGPNDEEVLLMQEGTYTAVYCADDQVWAAEFGKGVRQFSNDGQQFWDSANCGLEDNHVTAIYPVNPEMVLLTTRSGLSILDTKNGSCQNYNEENGLVMSSARNGAIVRRTDGKFLICGLDGAVILDTDKLRPGVTVSAPAVDYIHLQDRDLHVDNGKTINLSYRDNSLQIEFSNFDYKEEANGLFEYSFTSSGNDWHQANLAHPLSLVNLHPGKYLIRARYPGSSEISSFRFRIKAPWYLSNVAILCYAILLFIGGIYLAKMHYSRLLLGQRLKEKEAENEKWQKLLLKLSHELRTPISSISGNLELFLSKYGKDQTGIRYLHKAWNGTADMEKVLSHLLEIEDTDLIKFDDLPSYGTIPPVQFIPKAHTLLIADDNPEMRAMLEDIFSEEYTLLIAKDGAEAFDMAVKSQPDLIISDVMMPGMDGLALCAALRNEYSTRHIPVILLTAHAAEKNLIEGLNSGADDYLAKPFSVEILRAKCRSLIRMRETLNERVEPVTKVKTTPFLNAATSAVERHLYDPDLNVGTLCQDLNVSKTTLNRRLAELTGMSPRDFIEDIKLKYAATMLLKENSRVSEVADKLNFSSQKYFTLRFKKKFGKTPSTYIKGQD